MRLYVGALLVLSSLCLSGEATELSIVQETRADLSLLKKNPLSQPSVRKDGIPLPLESISAYTPPIGPVRNVAEFEPSEGALIRFPLGIPVTMVKELAADALLYCLVSSGEQSNAQSSFQTGGVKMSNVKFINVLTDSYWTRDYGPWWIIDGNGKFGVIDFKYNRPRPQDDASTPVVATNISATCYDMGLTTAGGDYMTDGYGIGASTKLVISENGGNLANVEKKHKDFLGLSTFLTMDDPLLGSSIDHIDCWGKFLSPDKILIKQAPQGNADYTSLEKATTFWKDRKSCYGTPYKIYRVTGTANNEGYTNSFILNKKVFVPISGTGNDAAALEIYKKAMPGYSVFGFTGTWQNTDAIHCRTHEMADRGMLYVRHIPLHDTVESKNGSGYPVDVTLIAYSGKNLISDSLQIWYKMESRNSFAGVKLQKVSGNNYSGVIPPADKNSMMAYYIRAVDESGRTETHPYIGAVDPNLFYAKTDGISLIANLAGVRIINAEVRNYPNPFTISTKIAFSMPSVSPDATLSVFSSNGRMIKQWRIDKKVSAVVWEGSDGSGNKAAAGVYYYVVRNGSLVMDGKMQLIK
jgi:agmatine/peptidylarginine deiminase